MKFIEAANKYKKTRLNKWSDGVHVEILNGAIFIRRNGASMLTFDELNSEYWEEYKETRKYLTTKESMQALLDGHKLQADNYDEDTFIYLCDQGRILLSYSEEAFNCFTKDSKFYIYEGE